MLSKPLLLAASALVLASATAASAQGQPSTGLDAWKAVVGNTIVGKTPAGEAMVEYFAPDGVVKSKVAGKADEGEWALRGDKVCTDYSEDDDDEEDSEDSKNADAGPDEEADCYALSLQGDALTLTDEAGKAREFKILPGNAEKL